MEIPLEHTEVVKPKGYESSPYEHLPQRQKRGKHCRRKEDKSVGLHISKPLTINQGFPSMPSTRNHWRLVKIQIPKTHPHLLNQILQRKILGSSLMVNNTHSTTDTLQRWLSHPANPGNIVKQSTSFASFQLATWKVPNGSTVTRYHCGRGLSWCSASPFHSLPLHPVSEDKEVVGQLWSFVSSFNLQGQ